MASDENPGTEERPFLTIGRAAELLQPGERVTVGPGVYRERVTPARGGRGPKEMICYEAGQGAIVRGSIPFNPTWQRWRVNDTVWVAPVPVELPEQWNPFQEENFSAEQFVRCDWARPIWGRPQCRFCPALAYQNGRRLKQIENPFEQFCSQAGVYWIDRRRQLIFVRPFEDLPPAEAGWELAVRNTVFAPQKWGLGYIHVVGFTVEHVANAFPWPELGAISTSRGHHWVIEGNVIREINATGIDCGRQISDDDPHRDLAGTGHIVRRNTISTCGISGVMCLGARSSLYEDNSIHDCAWHDVEELFNNAGIKILRTHNCVVRRNRIENITGGAGIWLDYLNVNSRVTQNVLIRVRSRSGAIFMEASQEPNLVDNNVVLECDGSGLYQHDCDEQIFCHNLVIGSRKAAIEMRICRGRIVAGRESTAKRNKIFNNVFIGNEKPYAISDLDNECGPNVIAGSAEFDLGTWQGETGWDTGSVVAQITARYARDTNEVRLDGAEELPRFEASPAVDLDFLGAPRQGDTATAGATDVSALPLVVPLVHGLGFPTDPKQKG